MSYFPCKIWSGDRTIRKTFMTYPKVDSAILQAQRYGLQGTKLVLECDGSEICGNPVFEYYLKANAIFLLLKNNEWWSEKATYTASIEKHEAMMKNYTYASDESENFANEDIKPFELTIGNSTAVENTNYQLTHYTEHSEIINSNIQLPTNSPQHSVDLDEDETSMSEARANLLETNELTELLFETFEIPWHKIPSDIMNLLNSKKKLGKRLNAFSNIIVDELRVFSYYIPIRIFRSAAQQIVSKYPHSFLEKDSKGNITKGKVHLLPMMRNRNNFLNRSLNNKSRSTADIDARDRRRPTKDKATNKMSLTSEQKQNYLKNLYGTKTTEAETEVIKTYMKDCFAELKQFLNGKPAPDIQKVKKEWPFIFERQYLRQYLSDLMNFDAYLFLKNFKTHQENITQFLKKSNKNNVLNVLQGVSEEKSIITGICEYFDEDVSFLFMDFEMGTSHEDIVQKIPTNAPFFALVKSDAGGQKEAAYIFIQATLVAEYPAGEFLELLTDVINYYFMFNMMYPFKISESMEFLVRLFYKFNSSSCRGEKADINYLDKVNAVLSNIANFEA